MLTQERRHNMIESFKETNGEEAAMALAESLFPADGFDARMDKLEGRMGRLDARMEKLEDKMDRHFLWVMGGIFGSYGAILAALGIGIAVVLRVS